MPFWRSPRAFAASCDRKPDASLVSGTIETDEVHVASRYGGRVEQILAQEGDALKPDQVIVQLDAAELEVRRNQIAATLEEMVNGPRKEEIEAAKNDWESQKSDLDLALADTKRALQLAVSGAISDADRDHTVKHADTLEKALPPPKTVYRPARGRHASRNSSRQNPRATGGN